CQPSLSNATPISNSTPGRGISMPSEAHSVSLAALLSPERARSLPADSRERALAAQSIHHLWHVLFDSAPGLLAALPPAGSAVFEGFLGYAEERQLVMSWEMHSQIALWLDAGGVAGFPPDGKLILELAQATAARWARSDQTDQLGLLIASTASPGEAIVAW